MVGMTYGGDGRMVGMMYGGDDVWWDDVWWG